jgi:uncharacterized membrane protein HdeD (DUF308 family)
MFRKLDARKRHFLNVAMATIICGAAILAAGIVELVSNLTSTSDFTSPLFKIAAGLVVISLGYIHLELELQRGK